MNKVTYKKKCKLCDTNFESTREWQKFCCRKHQAEYWKASLHEKGALVKRIEKLEEKLSDK